MRQPQVARGPLLALVAVLLVVPVVLAGWSVATSAAFLVEFLSDGRVGALRALTPPPTSRRLPIPGVAADLHEGVGCPLGWRSCSLVLVHGLTPLGKDEPRLRRAARLLARAGFAVAVPTVPGLTRLTLTPEDVETVVATVAALPPPVRVVGVSVGAGPALLAAADPRVRRRVATVLSLGGYASALELARFYLRTNPEAARLFAEANPALMDDSARRALAAGSIDRLSPAVRRHLDALSPERAVGTIAGRLLIVHGVDDPLVPYTESLRLAAAARDDATRVAIIGAIGHVEQSRRAARLVDLVRLWTIAYELIARPAL